MDLLVYLEEGVRTLSIGEGGPDFSSWGEDETRYILEWTLEEVAPGEEGDTWDWKVCLGALRAAGYYVRPADGSYGVLNHREMTMRLLPGVRSELRERLGKIVRFPVGEENTWLHCWRSRPPSRLPVLVVFHDTDESAADWVNFALNFRKVGADLFVVEYRGYGASEGGAPRLGDMLDDIPAIHDAVGMESERMVVYGRGTGALFAMEFADRYPNVQGVVLESAVFNAHRLITDVITAEEMGISDEALGSAVESALNQQEKLARFKRPLLILHGEGDAENPVADADLGLVASGSDDKMGVFYEKGGRGSLVEENEKEFFQEMAEFLVRTGPELQECYVTGFLGIFGTGRVKGAIREQYARMKRPKRGEETSTRGEIEAPLES